MASIKVIGILVGLVLLVWALSFWGKKYGSLEDHIPEIKDDINSWGEKGDACSTCQGACADDACDSPLPKSNEPIYYDDEELDRFAGRKHTDYSPEEVEEFRAVLTTLLPHDVKGWLSSLTQRLIALPSPLMEEANERMQNAQKKE